MCDSMKPHRRLHGLYAGWIPRMQFIERIGTMDFFSEVQGYSLSARGHTGP